MFKSLPIIVASVAILCVVPALISSSPISSNRNECKLLDDWADRYDVFGKYVTSSDNKALVYLRGVFKFTGPNESHRYSIVNLTDANWDQTGLEQELTLIDNCAEIKLFTRPSDDRKFRQLYKISAHFVDANGSPQTCQSEFTPEDYLVGKHLKIDMGPFFVQEMKCHHGEEVQPKLTLNIIKFEFELDGDPEWIERGNFSTKAYLY